MTTKLQVMQILGAMAAVAIAAVFGTPAWAQNTILTQWTFETGTSGNPPLANGTDITGISPATGTGTGSGHHASATTVWDNPSGNGTLETLSSNVWAAGDYYQFQTSTVGFTDLGVTFDQGSSNSGPRNFKFQYSTDGTAFTDFGTYQVQPLDNPGWSSTTPLNPVYDKYYFDLRSVDALEGQANVYFRLTLDNAMKSANLGPLQTSGTSRLDNFTVFHTYDPAMLVASTSPPVPPPPPAPAAFPQAGDVVFGFGTSRPRTTMEVVRGPASGTGSRLESPWVNNNFVRYVEFDNLGGTKHNVQGNLLGVDTGASAAAGGNIYSFATQGTATQVDGKLLANTASFNTRLGGLSVSPNNTRIALSGTDNGNVIVYNYLADNGMGTGAPTLTSGRQTAVPILGATNNVQGTAWLNDTTVLAFSTAGNVYEVNEATMASTLKTTVSPLPSVTATFTSLAFDPVSKFLFAMASGFSSGTSASMLYILDTANGYSAVNVDGVNLSAGSGTPPTGSVDTAREIALDKNGNLFIGSNSSDISVILGAVANAATLADFSATPWYTSPVFSSFNGFDIGFSALIPGDHDGDGDVDAADYVFWRENLSGQANAQDLYNAWRSNFGFGIPGSAAAQGTVAVPEPGSVVLLLIGLAAVAWRRSARD